MRHAHHAPGRTTGLAVLMAILFLGSHQTGTTSPAPPGAPASLCDLRHPVDVSIRPVGPVIAGQQLELNVIVGGSLELSDATVEFMDGGGTTPVGATSALLGSVSEDAPGTGRFTVQVPASGHRFLATFRVTAESNLGLITRTAAYNILPGGPSDAGAIVTTPEGETLRVYAASSREVK
jgi:hypothetical protein